ncbi:TetR/AcrR family transcriptional regulator [Couchioplanes caeruleus]|uniref:TetR/AcrR family transcriptional regulator n=1 Tax=Couchioplanes caeruleus TaxID=56438 RepID=UPI0031F83497
MLRLRGHGAITIEATAKQVGLTKSGLLYHFRSKEALMLAVVDHAADQWERLMLDELGKFSSSPLPPNASGPRRESHSRRLSIGPTSRSTSTRSTTHH